MVLVAALFSSVAVTAKPEEIKVVVQPGKVVRAFNWVVDSSSKKIAAAKVGALLALKHIKNHKLAYGLGAAATATVVAVSVAAYDAYVNSK